jgi:hypothetical protein
VTAGATLTTIRARFAPGARNTKMVFAVKADGVSRKDPSTEVVAVAAALSAEGDWR